MVGASKYGRSRLVEAHLSSLPSAEEERKERLNEQDPDGRTAVHYAVAHGDYETLSLLLCSGASASILDSRGRTALHYAAALEDDKLASRIINMIFLQSH